MAMRRLCFFVACLMLAPLPAQAAIARVVTTNLASADDNPTTTSADFTGTNLIVCVSIDHSSGGGGSVTSSPSNTFTGLSVPTLNNNARAKIWYVASPSVSSTMTFTFSGSGVFAKIICRGYSGAHASTPYTNQESGNSTGSGTTAQPGSLTPSEDNCLIVAGMGMTEVAGNITIDESFEAPTWGDPVSVQRGGGFSDKIQTTATAQNPTWTSTNNNAMTVVMAVFRPAAAGGATPRLMLLGVGP